MTTEQIIFDTIIFKESLDNALSYYYKGLDYLIIHDIFGQEVSIFTRNGEVKIMSDKKGTIWGANNHKGAQARLVQWLMSKEDEK